MAIEVYPSQIAKDMLPEKLIKKLVTKSFTVNRVVLAAIVKSGLFNKRDAERVALKVIKQYKKKYLTMRSEGVSKREALAETFNDKVLLVQRVNTLNAQAIVNEIKEKYRGMKYIWLSSEADEPRPLHQLKYGKVHTVGVGVMPSEEPNCQCGMKILTPARELDFYFTKKKV